MLVTIEGIFSNVMGPEAKPPAIALGVKLHDLAELRRLIAMLGELAEKHADRGGRVGMPGNAPGSGIAFELPPRPPLVVVPSPKVEAPR